MNQDTTSSWSEVIKPKRSLLELKLGDVWHYRDLLRMFVRRDFIATYKQTLLGPLWFFIQPVLTTIMFTLVFSRFAKIPTGGQPPIVFYLAGITIWNYFADCFTKTSSVFTSNAGIFGKVYFPRLIMPLSVVVSGLIKFSVQFLLFLMVWSWYLFKGTTIHPQWMYIVFLVPLLIIIMAGFALGTGMVISSLTTKYRDLTMLIQFGVSLLMYATPVIYSVDFLSGSSKAMVLSNPLSAIVEGFRFSFLGTGHFTWSSLAYSSAWMLAFLGLGILVFNKVERSFMDTV